MAIATGHGYLPWPMAIAMATGHGAEFRPARISEFGELIFGGGGVFFVITRMRNVIFDIFEPSAFQKYSICWVFKAFFVQLFFTCLLQLNQDHH